MQRLFQRIWIMWRLLISMSSICQSFWRHYSLPSTRCQRTAQESHSLQARHPSLEDIWRSASMRAGIRCVVWRYKVLVSPAFHMMRSLRSSSTQEMRAQCSQIHLLHRDIWSKICQRVSRTQAATVVEPCRASWVSAWE